MRVDSAHIMLPASSQEEQEKVINSIVALFRKVLDQLAKDKNLEKVTCSSGKSYDLEHKIFEKLFGKPNDNVVYAWYPKQVKSKL